MSSNFMQWLNTKVLFKGDERKMFYEILSTQIKAGIPPIEAVAYLGSNLDVSSNITQICEIASEKEDSLAEGLERTNFFSLYEIELIRLGETKGCLDEVLDGFVRSSEEKLNFLSRVFFPNLYFIIMFALTLVLAWNVPALMEEFDGISIDDNIAYLVGSGVKTYLPIAGIVLLVYLFIVIVGRRYLSGSARNIMLFFKYEQDIKVGIEFSRLAENLYRLGSTHSVVLENMLEIHGSTKHVVDTIDRSLLLYEVEGQSIENAISGQVLAPKYANLISALAPKGNRSLYEPAYRAIESIQVNMMNRLYSRASSVVRTLALLGFIGIFLSVFFGLMDTFTSFSK